MGESEGRLITVRLRFGAGVVIVALVAAGFAIVFRGGLAQALRALTGASDVVSAMSAMPIWVRLCAPPVGGLLAGLLGIATARVSAGRGAADVMEAAVVGKAERLSMRTTLLKSIACWLAITFGGSIGREGPLIQFGGAAGKVLGDRLQLPRGRQRLLIAAGTAAGFAAAYNTPFAAVLFVVEVIAGLLAREAMLPALAATFIATVVTRAAVGEGPIYGERAFSLGSPVELLVFAGLGLIAALVAQGFMRLVSVGERLFSRLPLPWRPCLGGLIAGSFIAIRPELAGNGYEPLNQLLDGGFAIELVLALLIGKAFATTASVSSGSPGGIVTPTLLLGGATGFLYATAMNAVGASIGAPGGYALVGMAAAFAATTHAPLMAAVMVFELSGDYAIVLPLALATTIGAFLSRHLRDESIYTAELRQRGIGW